MTPVGPRLIHPATYSPGAACPVAQYPARRVRHRPAHRVEGQPRQLHPAIADRAQDQLGLDVLVRSGVPHPAPAVRCRPGEPHPGHPSVALQQLHRPQEEPQPDAAPGVGGRRLPGPRPAAQDLQIPPHHGGQRQRSGQAVRSGVRRVERELRRVDDDPCPGQRPQLPQLLGGEPGLGGAPAAHDVHVAHPAVLQRAQRSTGHVGGPQLLGAARQDPGHVDRHIAHADHDGRAGVQDERVGADVGVGAVPGDEAGGGVTARQTLARHRERPVGRCPHAVDDRVVQLREPGGETPSAPPTPTLPTKVTRSSSSTARRLFCSDLIFSWSGATPYRTSPYGVGSRSRTCTRTSGTSDCWSRA